MESGHQFPAAGPASWDATHGAVGTGKCGEHRMWRGSGERHGALIGRRVQGSPPDHVSLASPVGKALAGTSAGDTVRVALPHGRSRELRVIEVILPVTDGLANTAKAA